jgi:uncharacterized membrane protein YgcG
VSEILEVSHLFPMRIKDAYTMLEAWNGNHRSIATEQVIRTLEEGNTMETYPYEYDKYNRPMAQKPKPPKPMPKVRALALVNTLKKSLVVASLAAFVSFGGLAAFHQVGTTATKTASASTTSPSTSSTQKNSKNFLKQSGGNTSGTSSSSSGTTSGSTNSSSSSSGTSSGTSSSTGSSSAVSGTHVS